MTKKKKIIVLTTMVALLVITGILNASQKNAATPAVSDGRYPLIAIP